MLKNKQNKQNKAKHRIKLTKKFTKKNLKRAICWLFLRKAENVLLFQLRKKIFYFLFYLFTFLHLGIRIEFLRSGFWRRQKLDIPSYWRSEQISNNLLVLYSIHSMRKLSIYDTRWPLRPRKMKYFSKYLINIELKCTFS